MCLRLVLAVLISVSAGAQGTGESGLYKDANATAKARAADLVSRMTLDEKISQMLDNAPAIPRLGVPAYNWWNEALHGVARAGLATVFPQAIGLAATFDTELEHRIADIISTEARAKYNDAIAHDNHARYHGLTFWSPNINIFRDPRWGRGQETYGEDPYLTARMALEFIHGMQGSDPHYLKTIATSKHFAVHSGPEISRHEFDVKPSEADLAATYLYAFHATLSSDDGAQSVMCAYNSLNGAPACANTFLLQDKLRKDWQFKGYVVSDCGAVGDIYKGHHYADSMAKAAADAVKSGTDLDCGTEYKSLAEAVQKGYITEQTITESVERLFEARFRLGMFDPPEQVPFSRLGMEEVASDDHRKLALKAAAESIVLLKNENHTLPFDASKPSLKLAVIGPAADDPDAMLGNYNGTPRAIITPLAGILQKFGQHSTIASVQGSAYAQTSLALIPGIALTPPNARPGEHGLLAEYFANDNFSGAPVLSRVEPRGYFVWAMHDPDVTKAIPDPTFSLRWSGTLSVTATGDYELGVGRQECDTCRGDNATRLFLDGQLLVDKSGRSYAGNQTFRSSVHLEAGRQYAIKVEYLQRQGGSGVELLWNAPPEALLKDAVNAAQQSDVSILCIGLNSRLEGEESPVEIPGFSHGDRTNIDLPEPQQKLLQAVLDTGKPVVVVLVNGSALAVNLAKQRTAAIVESWYGGEAAGAALADVLAGDVNPAGRLPVTFYESADQLPPFDDYSMTNRTYRYFSGKPLYPFGYGLSYSEFLYSALSARRAGQGKIRVEAKVANTSARAGDEVAQLYIRHASGKSELCGFERVHLQPKETRTVTFLVDASDVRASDSITVGGGQPLKEWTPGFLQTKIAGR